jgi:cobalt-precorrin 5A hydrolase
MDQSVRGSGVSTPEIDPVMPGVFIDDRRVSLPVQWLILRPKSLIAGIGCNRDTAMTEIKSLLIRTLGTFGLAYSSLKGFSTIDIKKNESGLNRLSDSTGIPVQYYAKETLNSVQNIRQPSAAAEKYLGVKSVCEAAAILASQSGELIVSKQKTRNVTLAIARTTFLS